MPTYSLFWDRNYNGIGNCCMTQPLDHPILVNEPTGGSVDAVHEEKYVQMIDVAWMNSEKMKWIGWDKQGYYAWITPKGMIYLFKDLKRNEKGKDWEKEHGEMRLPDDGRTQSFWPTGRDFYEWEKEVQENCGFCNDSRATMESGKESESGDKGSEGLDIPAWKNLLDGGGVTDLRKVTNTDDVTYRGFATDTSKIGYETYGAPYANGNDVDPSEYIGNHDASEYIGPVPYAPPVPMPTSTPTYTPPPRKQNPVINTQKMADISKVLTPAQSPFQKIMKERQKQFEESTKTEFKWDGTTTLQNPASVGTYGVTPTVNTKQQLYQGSVKPNPSTNTPTFRQAQTNNENPNENMHTSDMGLQFLIDHEGVKRTPYNDSKGYATIGIGHLLHTSPVNANDIKQWGKLSDEQVMNLFKADIVKFESYVKELVKVPLTQTQFDAIVSFTFNIGPRNLQKSIFLKNLNKGIYNGNLLLGFSRPAEIIGRRTEEALLFQSGQYRSHGSLTKLNPAFF